MRGVKLGTERGRYDTRRAKVAAQKLTEFKQLLPRILNQAVRNHWILPERTILSITELRKTYGVAAEAEFKAWFNCKRLLNPQRLDRVNYRLERGEITQGDYDLMVRTWCYAPVWIIKEGAREDAHRLVDDKLTS